VGVKTGGDHRCLRILIEVGGRGDLPEPPRRRLVASVVRLQARGRKDLHEAPHVPAGGCVLERALVMTVLLAPGRGTSVENGHELRLRRLQLSSESALQQTVIAEPLPTAVEGHDEGAQLVDRLDPACACVHVQHGVAHRQRDAVENRRPP
jgi:hypothetical protein